MHINLREGIRKAREGTKTVKFAEALLLISTNRHLIRLDKGSLLLSFLKTVDGFGFFPRGGRSNWENIESHKVENLLWHEITSPSK